MGADLKSATGFIWFSIAGKSKKKKKKSKEENIIYKRNSPLDYIKRKYNPMVNFSKFTFYIIYIYIYIDWSYDY